MIRTSPVYRHPEVASLAWMIYSCPMMNEVTELNFFTESWCDMQYENHRGWLDQLDTDPTILLEWIEKDAQKLLGKKFESLVAFWFEHSPYFELLYRNVLIKKDGNTSGEVDLIVCEKSNGEIWHVEVACKYFIQRDKGRRWTDWTGPNEKDSLDEKLQKFRRQVNLLHTEDGQRLLEQIHLQRPLTYVMLKGYFFHHFRDLQGAVGPLHAHPHYHSGWYCSLDELSQFGKTPRQWLPIPKSLWICTYHFEVADQNILNGSELQEYCDREIQRTHKAVLIAQVIIDGTMIHEISRGFVIRQA